MVIYKYPANWVLFARDRENGLFQRGDQRRFGIRSPDGDRYFSGGRTLGQRLELGAMRFFDELRYHFGNDRKGVRSTVHDAHQRLYRVAVECVLAGRILAWQAQLQNLVPETIPLGE